MEFIRRLMETAIVQKLLRERLIPFNYADMIIGCMQMVNAADVEHHAVH